MWCSRKAACILLIAVLYAVPHSALSQLKGGGGREWRAHFEDDAYFEAKDKEERMSTPAADASSFQGHRLRFKPAADVYFNMVTL